MGKATGEGAVGFEWTRPDVAVVVVGGALVGAGLVWRAIDAGVVPLIGLLLVVVGGALAYAIGGRAIVAMVPVVVALAALGIVDLHEQARRKAVARAPLVTAKAYDSDADAYLVTLEPGGVKAVESWQFERAEVGEKYLPGPRPRRRTPSGAWVGAMSGGR